MTIEQTIKSENQRGLKIYVIIVMYNGTKWIEKCCGSLRKSTIPLCTIVIDNKSSDKTVDIIKERYPEIILIESDKNLGFGKANNIGIEYAIAHEADYVFLLNQDAWIYPDMMEKLLSVNASGIISPIHLDGTGEHLNIGFLHWISGFIYKNEILNDLLVGKIKQLYEVEFINAAAWLLPLETIRTIGGFDPIFFHYGEDFNYGQRLRYHGLSFYFAPNAFVCHDNNHKGMSPSFLRFQTRHNFLLLYANINRKEWIIRFLGCYKRLVINLFQNLVALNFHNLGSIFSDIFFIVRQWSNIQKSKKTNRVKGMNWLKSNSGD